jgi:hypothetical protein
MGRAYSSRIRARLQQYANKKWNRLESNIKFLEIYFIASYLSVSVDGSCMMQVEQDLIDTTTKAAVNALPDIIEAADPSHTIDVSLRMEKNIGDSFLSYNTDVKNNTSVLNDIIAKISDSAIRLYETTL